MYISTETSPCLAGLDRPASGNCSSAADISVPERFATANEVACFCLGVQYAEAGEVGPRGRLDNLDKFGAFYPWEAHAFDCGARSVAGPGEARGFSAYQKDHLKRQPEAYAAGWAAEKGALNAYGEENLKCGPLNEITAESIDLQSKALAFEAGQSARASLETCFGLIG